MPDEGQVAGMISEIESQMDIFPFAASGAPVHARCVTALACEHFCLPHDYVKMETECGGQHKTSAHKILHPELNHRLP